MSRILLILLIFFAVPTDRVTWSIAGRLVSANAEVDNISNGGCGYFALYLYDYLADQGIQSEIVAMNWSNKVPEHIMVRVKGRYIDNHGIYTPIPIWIYSFKNREAISRDQLLKLLNEPGWNTQFNKADTIKLKSIFNQ